MVCIAFEGSVGPSSCSREMSFFRGLPEGMYTRSPIVTVSDDSLGAVVFAAQSKPGDLSLRKPSVFAQPGMRTTLWWVQSHEPKKYQVTCYPAVGVKTNLLGSKTSR